MSRPASALALLGLLLGILSACGARGQAPPVIAAAGDIACDPADANFNGVVLFAKTGVPEILRTSVQKLQVAERETVQNRPTLHLRGEVSGEKLNPLVGSTLKSDVMYPVDCWIDEQSANIARIHVTEPEGNGWLIELFGTNEPVDIPTPQLPPATPKPQD